MRKTESGVLSVLVVAGLGWRAADDRPPEVRVVPDEAAGRVDVLVDGRPFTTYRFAPSLKKPVLFPLLTPRGTPVTRGYPLEPRPGERVDHPHHLGLWLNYGDVDGVDFWNNSDARPPQEASRMGTVVHRRVARAAGGRGSGTLEVTADWLMPDGRAALAEQTTYLFRAEPETRLIDRTTTLTAQDRRVALGDNKEGLLGIRVARFLEHPSDRPEVLTDSSGRPRPAPVADTTGVNGLYRSSEGTTGDAVWGTRGRWVSLAGRAGDEAVTLTVLDHPRNPNHPTFWHARGYGLFAANPLGGNVFVRDLPVRKLSLEPGQSVSFRYRVVIRSRATSPEETEKDYARFLGDVP
jgi:hypothetical protein